jgi:Tol biopolymer transport system component
VIAFEAPQSPGASNRDIFIYQARLDTVFAMTAANSPADESSPKLSSDRKWLAFRRTTTDADHDPHSDLLLLDTVAQRINVLQNLNTAAFDESEPDLSGDARWIAYVTDRGDVLRLGLYDVKTGTNYELPGADRGFVEVHNPRLFDKDRRIAFSASAALPDGQAGTLDIYIYDLTTGRLWQPPFVNSPFNEDNPDVSDDSSRMLFDSDRFGSLDLFEANLVTGMTDNLSFANTAAFDERSPRYYGKDDAWVRYKLNPAPSADPDGFLLRVYHPSEGLVDTLSVPNQLLDKAPAAP